ncbi:hypothetical protein [Micromonospora sp. HK10]|uniref:hypothetical protein n=1 Tax=Micromonospora sp. HK10 TaxID=1538294 RepID=UPI00062732CB|nr:hypothetical protein [Micromonospora sp. HK10]KKK05001.1 hypothetical protein LQ51_16410 [Micromonospora sp. HK10]
MAYAGSRTMNVGTWLLPEDEDAFDRALRDTSPGAAWQCSQPGPPGLHPVHLHGSLANAMACGGRGIQAFLHLPIGASLPSTVTLADDVPLPDGPPIAATVQLLRSTRRHDPDGTYCDHDAGYQHPVGGPYFDAGRLAVRWFEDDVGSGAHEVLLRQTREVRSVLTATTGPARIKDQNGRPLTGYRIGPAAQAMAEATGTLLGRPGLQRFQLG